MLASDAISATVALTTEQLHDVGAQLASVEESVGGVREQVCAVPTVDCVTSVSFLMIH